MNINSLNQATIIGRVISGPVLSNSNNGGYATAVFWVETKHKLAKSGRTGKPRLHTVQHKCILYREMASKICDEGNIEGRNINVIGTITNPQWTGEDGTTTIDPRINVLIYTLLSDNDEESDTDETAADADQLSADDV